MYFSLLSALALTQLASAAVELEFDPPVLNLIDSSLVNKFRCRLKSKPEAPVQVYFEGTLSVLILGAGVTFSNCSVNIPVEKYGEWQEISVNSVPTYDTRTLTTLSITASSYTQGIKADSKYDCQRTITQAGNGATIGDPHFSMLDGYTHDNMGEGTYHLFDHPDLSIQTTQASCLAPGMTCNHACAVRYGSSIMAIDLRAPGELSNQMTQITKNTDGIVYTAPTADHIAHELKFPCGSTLSILPYNNKVKDIWLDINFHVAPGYQNSGGLLNNVNSNGQLKCRDGSLVERSDIETFANSWSVKDNESLLLNQYVASKPNNAALVCKIAESMVASLPPPVPVLPPYVAPAPVTTTKVILVVPTTTTTVIPIATTTLVPVVTTTTVFSTLILPASITSTAGVTATIAAVTTVVPVVSSITILSATTITYLSTTTVIPTTVTRNAPVTVIATTSGIPTTSVILTSTVSALPTLTMTIPQPPPQFTQEVAQHCNLVLTVPGCNGLVDQKFFVDSCVADCHASGTYAMVEAARLSYMAQCRVRTGYMLKDATPIVASNGAVINKQAGLGDNACHNSCSANGDCTSLGCVCKPGFSGLDCSANLANLVSLNPESQKFDTTPIIAQFPDPIKDLQANDPSSTQNSAQSTSTPLAANSSATTDSNTTSTDAIYTTAAAAFKSASPDILSSAKSSIATLGLFTMVSFLIL